MGATIEGSWGLGSGGPGENGHDEDMEADAMDLFDEELERSVHFIYDKWVQLTYDLPVLASLVGRMRRLGWRRSDMRRRNAGRRRRRSSGTGRVESVRPAAGARMSPGHRHVTIPWVITGLLTASVFFVLQCSPLCIYTLHELIH